MAPCKERSTIGERLAYTNIIGPSRRAFWMSPIHDTAESTTVNSEMKGGTMIGSSSIRMLLIGQIMKRVQVTCR